MRDSGRFRPSIPAQFRQLVGIKSESLVGFRRNGWSVSTGIGGRLQIGTAGRFGPCSTTGQPVWNPQFLDFSLRVGFNAQLCHPYRPQTKGRVESGIKYVKRNFWPGVRFTDLDDLNRQALLWCDTVANVRIHGTTHERPIDRLAVERHHLQPLPGQERLQPFLRESRTVGRDGYVQWDRSWYGVPWPWKPGEKVEVQPGTDIVQLWTGDRLLAVHPRATRPGQ